MSCKVTTLSLSDSGASLANALAILSVKLSLRRLPTITTTLYGLAIGFPFDADAGLGWLASLSQRLQRRFPRIFRLRSQFLLDAQQLIVLGGAVGARQRTGFDLAAIGRDREVGDGGILGLAGTV